MGKRQTKFNAEDHVRTMLADLVRRNPTSRHLIVEIVEEVANGLAAGEWGKKAEWSDELRPLIANGESGWGRCVEVINHAAGMWSLSRAKGARIFRKLAAEIRQQAATVEVAR